MNSLPQAGWRVGSSHRTVRFSLCASWASKGDSTEGSLQGLPADDHSSGSRDRV